MHDSDVSVPAVPGVAFSDYADDVAWVEEAYANYALSLYAYCRSLVRDPVAAADAVVDTFVVLAFRLADLPDETFVRSWLFAVARNECLRAISFGHAAPATEYPPAEAGPELPAPPAPTLPLAVPPPPTLPPWDYDADGAATLGPPAAAQADSAEAETAGLLSRALGGLAGAERDIMLMVWHGLNVAECAEVLGVSRDEADRLFFRAREELEASAGVLTVAYSSWHECAALNMMLAGWDGRLTPALRGQFRQHIDRCDICGDQRRRGLTTAVLLRLSPDALRGVAATASASPPAAWVAGRLREQVLAAAFGQELEYFEHRAMVVRRAGPFRDDGFPVALLAPGASPRRQRSRTPFIVAGSLAAVLVIVVAGVALALTANHSNGALPAWNGMTASSRSSGAAGTTNATGSPSASPSHTPSPTATTPSASATPTPRPSATSTPTPAKTTAPPAPAGLSVSPASLTLSTHGPSVITLSNPSGATVSWSVSIPAGSRLMIWGPSSGQVGPHQSVSVNLFAQFHGHGNGSSSTVIVTVNPGNVHVTVTIPANGQQG